MPVSSTDWSRRAIASGQYYRKHFDQSLGNVNTFERVAALGHADFRRQRGRKSACAAAA